MGNAIHRLFNHPRARGALLALRLPLALLLLALVAHYAQVRYLPAAFAVSLAGELLQLWAFASLVKNEQLTARGPYVLVRNPMYLGRFVLILGLVLLLGNTLVIAIYAVLYYFYMVNRVAREELRLARLLGAPYRDYCARVNRFLPRIAQLSDPAARFFSGEMLRRNHGYGNLAAMLLSYAALYAYLHYLR